MSQPTRILLAEDELLIAIIIQDLLTSEGYSVHVCSDGLSAWENLQATQPPYDIILLDRGLPGLDGLELLRRIKSDTSFANTPVIIETAQGDHESIHEGLIHGAYYYLTKPFQAEVLLAVVKAAEEQSKNINNMLNSVRSAERPVALLQMGSFRFHNLDEAVLLANYLAQACPEPERAVQGLQELLTNAVEHGNLEISYAEKGALLLKNTWHDEIARRLQLPEYRTRYVNVHFQRQAEFLQFTVQDQGTGFDWSSYLEFSSERAFDLHGRGIAIAKKLSFDYLEYQGNGNTVVARFYTLASATAPHD